MKIGLIYPNKANKDKSVHLGLGYLASYARKVHDNLQFKLLDTRVATDRETREFFNTQFELVGITLSVITYHEAATCISRIKRNYPSTRICVGGPYVSMVMDDILRLTDIDYAVYGEGEITFAELIGSLKGETDISTIKGLIYRKTGAVINPPRPLIENLDALPLPAYDLFRMHRYTVHRIITSRGCPHECNFCLDSQLWKGQWRKRQITDVIREIVFLFDNYKTKNVIFIDNSFDIDVGRIEHMCNEIVRRRLTFLWSANVRGENITRSLAKKLKQAGCYNVSTGIESANNRVLEKIGKKVTIEQMSLGIRNMKEEGIEVMGMFMIGNTGDTLETVQESIAWAKSSGLDKVKFYSAIPYKGTPLYKEITRTGGRIIGDIMEYDKVDPPVFFETPEFPYEKRVEAIRLARDEGYFWYCFQDHNDRLIDLVKMVTWKIQSLLPPKMARAYFLSVKWVFNQLYWRR